MNQRRERVLVFAVVFAAALLLAEPVCAYASGDSRKLNKEANELFLAGNYAEALVEYEEILSAGAEKQNFQAEYGRAMCLVKTERYYQALEQLQDMSGTDEEEMLRISDARRQIKNALAQHPNEDVISYYRNRIAGAKSFEAVKILLSDNPDYPQTEYYRALFYAEIFDFELQNKMSDGVLMELSLYYEAMLDDYPWQEELKSFYESVMALQIDRCFEAGLVTEAEELTDRTLKRNPESAKFLSGKGEVLLLQKEYEEAEEYFKRAVNKEERLLSAHENLLKCLFWQREYAEAVTVAEGLLCLDDDNIYAYAYMGAVYRKTGRRELSEEYIQRVESAPDDYNKVCALALTGSGRSAVLLLEELAQQDRSVLSYAKYDSDLNSLHIRPDFRNVVGEDYTEEFANIYSALFAAAGLLFYFVLAYFEWKKKKIIKMTSLFLGCVLIASALMAECAHARDFQLRRIETEQIYGGNDLQEDFSQEEPQDYYGTSSVFLEDEICREEIDWFTEDIEQGLRTVLPLDVPDADKAARLVEPATVNVQAILAGSIYGQGSGVIAACSEEEILIIGCRHTLYTERLRVRFTDGTYAPAKIVGKSEDHDFMVLGVDPKEVPEETLQYIRKVNVDYEASKALAALDPLITNGYITTRGYMYFEGKVTSLRKIFSDFEPDYTNHVPYLLTDTDAAAGTSGGGTFDAYGNFIGLQAGIVLSTKERYVVPLDTVAGEYQLLTGEMLE